MELSLCFFFHAFEDVESLKEKTHFLLWIIKISIDEMRNGEKYTKKLLEFGMFCGIIQIKSMQRYFWT